MNTTPKETQRMRRYVTFLVFCFSLNAAECCHGEEPWFQQESGTFTLMAKGHSFVTGGTTFCQHDKPAAATEDNTFAFQDTRGHQIEYARSAESPFTTIHGTIHNNEPMPTITKAIDVATFPLELGVPPGALKVLGTGGLSDAIHAAGSYMWIAVVEPKSGRGVVAGWLSSHRGSGVILPTVVAGRVVLTARLEYGRLRLSSGAGEPTETFLIGQFEDVRLGLEAYAEAVAKAHNVRLLPQPCGYCTWYHAGASTAPRLKKLAAFAAKELKPFGFSVVQIDDGWQAGVAKNGPRKNFTIHRTDGPYPLGMTETATQITAQKLTPGLWFMPFAGTWNDPFFADRQEWFAKQEDGKPFDTEWGGTCLDLTNPAVKDYLRANVQRITHDWGYKYLKMDGLWTGSATKQQYVNDAYKDDQIGNGILFNPDKTNLEALRDGLKLIRDAAGPDVFLLGCCAPQNMRSYGGAIGLVDAMRIGPDNGATPDGLLVGPRYGSRNYFLHGRVWWNDPDPIYVRTSLSLAQAELSATWAAISGQLTIASDDLEVLPPDRLNILKRVIPSHGQIARPVDLFDRDLPRVWVVPATDQSFGRTVVGLFNWDQAQLAIDEPLQRLGLDPEGDYVVFDFWSGKLVDFTEGRLHWTLEPLGKNAAANRSREGESIPHCCAALSLVRLVDHPQLLSTSRHVTQGLVDVTELNWNSASQSLTGISRVVGRDPYELRILIRTTSSPWKLTGSRLDDSDSSARVTTISDGSANGLLRIRLDAKESREVKWSVTFARDDK